MRPCLPPLGSPPGLVVDCFEEGGQTFAVLEWPGRGGPGAVGAGVGALEAFRLSRAQRQVLDLLLSGLSNAEIARRRGRSVHTVAHQVDEVFRRLRVGSRLELYALAASRGRAGAAP